MEDKQQFRKPTKNLTKIGTISLSEVIREEFKKAFESNQQGGEEMFIEAEISTALSFLQDVQSSTNKLIDQNKLKGTNPEVDRHLSEAIAHLHDAIEAYFDSLNPEIKDKVSSRIGEIRIK